MEPVLITIHVIVSVLLVLVVLIQSGRSGGISGLFGGGSDALFTSSSQQSGLRTATMIIAAIFMATSVGLTLLGKRHLFDSVTQRPVNYRPEPVAPSQPSDAAPAADPQQASPSTNPETEEK